ncbi:hypothetical protein CVT25_008153 [Psilocybe cyanescens]|uniref:Uncharacterized protein n=1 Tax=Psilocybe cyanescens TaxID=93625 RepID=A0A409XSI8_PSICY|nr:hypothetical protein CVT25_008153 [Psilocybe cyanescens]
MPSPLKNQPPLNIARFTGFFIECILTGVYWVHFYLYVESVRKRSKSAGENLFKTPMFVVGATLFIIATGHWLTSVASPKHFLVLVISSFIALVNFVNTDTPSDQRGYLSLNPNWIIAYNAVYIPIPVVADAFLTEFRVVTEAVAARLFTASINTIFDKSRRCLLFSKRNIERFSFRAPPSTDQSRHSMRLASHDGLTTENLIQGICFCMIVTRPYNVDVGQTIGTVTSVQHPWHGSTAPFRESPGQEEEGFGIPEDPEKTLAGNDGKPEDRHVIEHEKPPCRSALNMAPAIEISECVVVDRKSLSE